VLAAWERLLVAESGNYELPLTGKPTIASPTLLITEIVTQGNDESMC
jgi:hypothetical protein